MKKKIWIYFFCLLSICLLGCGQEKRMKSTDNLKIIMKELFHPISDEEYQEFKNNSSIFSSSGWMGKRFKGAMTEDAYKTFLETGTYQMMMLSYENGCNIEIEKIEIKEKKDYDEFQIKLHLSDKSGDDENLEVNGTAQFDENGKVRYFNLNNIDKLVGILKKVK